MAFSIKNEEADKLVRQLTTITGETLTEAVLRALRERLNRYQISAKNKKPGTELEKIAAKLRGLPTLDPRPADEILGYDGNGLPT